MSIDLSKIPNRPDKDMVKKDDIKEKTQKMLEKIAEYQRIMYAQEKYSMLIILQWMDAAGKDWTIRDIFTGVNPLGCKVFGFKKPTDEEASHDFLRRIHEHTPANGMIHIFNRSHYEDVLVPAVEKYASKKEIETRYEHINAFERLLEDNDTKVLKFYLHISREEQKKKLEKRIELPQKHWKHNDGDRDSRAKWDCYMDEYHKIFKKCDAIPWHVIPADKKWWKIYNVCKVIIDAFEEMDLKWPKLETELFNEKKKEE